MDAHEPEVWDGSAKGGSTLDFYLKNRHIVVTYKQVGTLCMYLKYKGILSKYFARTVGNFV